ncbi:hypothetical protein ACWCQQ_49070 [Streptomyces sp. NPDC002143]
MLWSSHGDQGYAIGLAHSASGHITGPWTQDETALWPEDGGHGMIVRLADGELALTLHQPNGTPDIIATGPVTMSLAPNLPLIISGAVLGISTTFAKGLAPLVLLIGAGSDEKNSTLLYIAAATLTLLSACGRHQPRRHRFAPRGVWPRRRPGGADAIRTRPPQSTDLYRAYKGPAAGEGRHAGNS